MKILYHHRIASKDGQYVHLEEIVNAMKGRGHEVLLVGPSIVEKDYFGSDGGFISLMKKYIPKFLYEFMEFSYNFYDFLKLAFAVRKFKPDFIYERYNLYFISGLWVKKIFKLPHILEVNSPLYSERNKYNGISLNFLAKWTECYAWTQSDYLLPVTGVLENIIRETILDRENIKVIHNGINKEQFKPNANEIEALQHTLKNKTVLGFTGFVREWHGIEQVVDFIAEHKKNNLHLLLVGDGPASNKIQAQAKKLGVAQKLTITGIVERDDIANYISLFDIALQPAVVEYASPLKLFEYLYMGCLIVAPDSLNIKEILEDNKNAVLFENNNMMSFKQSLDRAININNACEIRDNAKKTIDEKKLTWVDNVKQIEQLFNNLKEI